jgi:hypothetical protein
MYELSAWRVVSGSSFSASTLVSYAILRGGCGFAQYGTFALCRHQSRWWRFVCGTRLYERERVAHGARDTQCCAHNLTCRYHSDNTKMYESRRLVCPISPCLRHLLNRALRHVLQRTSLCLWHMCKFSYISRYDHNNTNRRISARCVTERHAVSFLLAHDDATPHQCHPTLHAVCCCCENRPHIRVLHSRQLPIPPTYCEPVAYR